MNKDFRLIDGFPGYRISRTGEVQSRWLKAGPHSRLTETWKPLKPIRNPLGYRSVNLHAGGRKVTRKIHRLVLEAFVGPRPEGLVCCHNDGDPSNNRVENLRWDTHQANMDDMLRHGRRRVGEQARSKLTGEQVLTIRRLHAEGNSLTQLGKAFGVTSVAVFKIVKGRSWRHLLPSTDAEGTG